jgi:lysophospholipid hydrolase
MSSVRHLFTDITLPLISIFSGNHFWGLIKESFGSKDIEDLWLNFYCTSTNLSSGEVEVRTLKL